jgi:hypothetical protein
MLCVPFVSASSSIAASLIWHCTVSPSFIIVNANANRSLSCPKIWPRVSGIENLSFEPECGGNYIRNCQVLTGSTRRVEGSS